jgi:predicted RNase H-like HicB family nuclease
MLFHVSIKHGEDGLFYAICPALPQCVSHGQTEKEALENIRQAILKWFSKEDQKATMALSHSHNGTPVIIAV